MKSLEIRLKEEEIEFLNDFVKNGYRKAKEIYRANVLLLANEKEKDAKIAEILSIDRNTVFRIKKGILMKV